MSSRLHDLGHIAACEGHECRDCGWNRRGPSCLWQDIGDVLDGAEASPKERQRLCSEGLRVACFGHMCDECKWWKQAGELCLWMDVTGELLGSKKRTVHSASEL